MRRQFLFCTIVAFVCGAVIAGQPHFGTSAQEESSDLAGHPLVGTWLAMTPFGAAAETFSADGSFVAGYSATEAGDEGTRFLSPGVGVWESTGENSGHFTSVQSITDATGTFIGSLTIDGYLDVSDDSQNFIDDSPDTTLTYRDGTGAVVQVIKPFEGGGEIVPVTGIRIDVGEPGFPEATPSSGLHRRDASA
jgi:hypothetical protein